MKIIGLCGFAGSGKSTIAEYLVEYHDFIRLSFAQSLKDVTAAAFGWPRQRLEGASSLDREWRETADPFWSEQLGRPFSPRIAFQYIGTDIFRAHIHPDFWVYTLITRINQLPVNSRIIIDDVRFVNERNALHGLGATFVKVRKSTFTTSEHEYLWYNAGSPINHEDINLHISEWEWLTHPTAKHDAVIINGGSFDELYRNVELSIVENL